MVSGVSSSLVGLHRVGSREADDLLAESGAQGQLALRGGPVLALPARGADAYAQLLEVGIHTVPGRYFHSTGHVRLPFGAAPETVSRLAALLEGFTPNTGRRLDP